MNNELSLVIGDLKCAINHVGNPSISSFYISAARLNFEAYCALKGFDFWKDIENEPVCGSTLSSLGAALRFLEGLKKDERQLSIYAISDTVWILDKMLVRQNKAQEQSNDS